MGILSIYAFRGKLPNGGTGNLFDSGRFRSSMNGCEQGKPLKTGN